MKLAYILPFSLILTACGNNGSSSNTPQTDNGNSLNLVKQISAGLNYLCGITLDNIPKCLGENNNSGQQGIGNTNANYSTTQVQNLSNASFVSSGITNTCFINDENIYCSGDNTWGQLGNGTFTNSSAPTQVTGITNVEQIAVSDADVCALKNDGKIFCWGIFTDHTDPVHQKNSNVPVQLNSNLIFKSISNGDNSEFCAVTTDGSVYCWLTGDLYPQQINGLSNIKSVTSGGSFSCALNQSGQAFCWGSDESGQLGDGKNETEGRPVQVLNIKNFSLIFSSQATTCGITTDHKTYCWGRGTEGQLGNGSTSNSNVPVQVNTTVQFTQIAGSLETTYAVDTTGNTYVWGTRTLTTSAISNDLTPVKLNF